MICKKCRREIGPEDLKCPYCGADHPFAVQHKKNMDKYAKDFSATTGKLKASERKMGELGKKAGILVVLILCILIVNLIASFCYIDPDTEEEVKKDADRNAAKYAEEIDALLERGEYTECLSFMKAHGIDDSWAEGYKKFRQTKYLINAYNDCIGRLEKIILRSPDPEYFDSLDTEKDEKYRAYFADMEKELRMVLRTYFDLDEEELEELLSLSRAQKAVRLEEILRHE